MGDGAQGSKAPDDPKKKEAAIVDNLLRQLKYADPTLKGDEPAKPPARPQTVVGIQPRVRPAPSAKRAWAWTGFAAVLAGAITQWPYAHGCGFGLLGYGALLVTWGALAVWAATETWRARRAVAHVISLVLIALALAAIAGQVLPRVGYTRVPATWRCGTASASSR